MQVIQAIYYARMDKVTKTYLRLWLNATRSRGIICATLNVRPMAYLYRRVGEQVTQ